jgi:thiol:disulfide interchange protein
MQLQQKLGYGFILFGVALTLAMYFLIDGGAFVFTALVGFMAIVFGAFQLMISTNTAVKSPAKSKAKKGHK